MLDILARSFMTATRTDRWTQTDDDLARAARRRIAEEQAARLRSDPRFWL